MAYLVAVVLGLAFGAADQYLGSRSALGLWAAAVSQMSAPWLVLPFVAGMTQRRPRKAMILGLVVTASALVGYVAMTYSPMEGVPLDRFAPGVVAMARSGYNPAYFLAGLVTGPLFGYLGQRWRVHRSWASAAVVVGALCLEPLARRATGQLWLPVPVWGSEIALGVVVAAAFAFVFLTALRAAPPASGSAESGPA